MKNKIFAGLAVATTLGFLIPIQSHAFGLGNLKIHSALNQPLNAEIALTAVTPSEQDNIQVRLASADEFTKAGLDRSYVLTKLKFNVVYTDNKPRVVITSDEPIREPFLDFLITASSGDGQMIREYTVLLDPPKQVFNEAPVPTSPSSSSQPAQTYSATSTQATTTAKQYSGTPGQYGPTGRTDTLFRIASKTRPEQDLTVNQMMIALLKANPQAFQNDNINGLKAGYTLSIPSSAEVRKLSRAQAIAAVREQNQLWKNRNQPAQAAVKPQAAEMPSAATGMTESASDTAQQNAATTQTATSTASKTGQEAKLELVSPDEKQQLNDDKQAPQGDKKLTQLTQQLTLAQEAIEAQNQENVDIKQRMSMMEEQLKTLHRLIDLKDADLARMQSLVDKGKKAPAGAATDAASVADQTLSAMDQPTNNQINLLGDSAATANSTDNTNTATNKTDQTASSESSEQEKNTATATTAPAEKSAVTSAPTTTPSEVDEVVDKTAEMLNLNKDDVHTVLNRVKQFIIQNELEAGLGALLVLLILWLIIRRRNRVIPWNEAVEDLADRKSVKAETKSDTHADEPLTAPEVTEIDSIMPDVRVKTVDELVEQADMFVGYADYVQAKSSLEQAHALDPDNALVIQKLLFVLYKQKQTDAFINMAQSAEMDRDSEEWRDIASWGRELAPASALFAIPVAVLAAAENKQDEDAVEPQQDQVSDTSALEQTDDLNLKFADNEPEKEHEQTIETAEDDGNIDFDLSDYDFKQSPESEVDTEAAAAESEKDDNVLAFDLDTVSPPSDDELQLDSELPAAHQHDADVEELAENDELSSLSFDLEPAHKDEPDSLDLDETELDTISDAELEEAAHALGHGTDDEMTDDSLTEDLDFDIGDFDEIDEAETKLDLAAAYIDMGDPDGARSILEEVLKEGSDEQKTRAQTLLKSITE